MSLDAKILSQSAPASAEATCPDPEAFVMCQAAVAGANVSLQSKSFLPSELLRSEAARSVQSMIPERPCENCIGAALVKSLIEQ